MFYVTWNDATGFFSAPCSPMNKDQLTGLGFSNNRGASFSDLGGLPNSGCATSSYSGDPAVAEYTAPNGTPYFYVASLLSQSSGSPFGLLIGIDVCSVVASSLSCSSTPIVISSGGGFNLLDKEFVAVDQARNRLYLSYTDFTSGNNIDLSVCDLSSPGAPVCQGTGYLTLASSSSCAELEGAYPAVDPATGDVYVSWENNWATNLSGCGTHVQEQLAHVPFACLTLTASAACGPDNTVSWDITSMDGAFIPGYNRFPANDFPRIAVSGPAGTVSVVWNDAGKNPLGNILMQSFNLGTSLTPVQGAPVQIDEQTLSHGPGALHFLPALRNADKNGNLDISWFDRRNDPKSGNTDVYAALGINPRLGSSNTADNVRVTNTSTNWLAVSSDIVPNFGDYTDNYISPSLSKTHPGENVWVAWADGRLSAPMAFAAHANIP